MDLNASVLGEGPPLLIAHGLFGSARNWGAIAKRMSESRKVTVPDMRNHGDSPWADSHTYLDQASDLSGFAGGDVVGHSMGGKAAMALALTEPERVKRLVVADIAPVAYTHSQSHLIDALEALDLAHIDSRGAADRALAGVIEEAGVRAFLLQSLDVAGKRWRLNLQALRDEMDTITGWTPIKGRFEGPALFLSGGESDYVLPEHRESILSQFPRAKFASIPGAGHWLHAEKPREFQAAVETFFRLTEGAP